MYSWPTVWWTAWTDRLVLIWKVLLGVGGQDYTHNTHTPREGVFFKKQTLIRFFCGESFKQGEFFGVFRSGRLRAGLWILIKNLYGFGLFYFCFVLFWFWVKWNRRGREKWRLDRREWAYAGNCIESMPLWMRVLTSFLSPSLSTPLSLSPSLPLLFIA